MKVKVLLLTTAMALGTVGCVAQGERDNLQRLYRQAQEQIIDLQSQIEEKNAQIDALRNQGPDQATLARLRALEAERNALQQALADAEAQLREAGTASVALPQDLDTALRDLAQQYPDLMEYDAQRGMVKFRSDLTFALGSADVNPGAQATLQRLAGILQQPVAQGYEVRIVGHTDAAPIQRPDTRQRHPNNWYLSAHRAISVRDVMERAGLQPSRLGVGGYGQYRPIAPNDARGQSEANRRVEIFIVEMPGNVGMGGGSPATSGGASAQPMLAPVDPAPAPAAERPAQPETPEMFK